VKNGEMAEFHGNILGGVAHEDAIETTNDKMVKINENNFGTALKNPMIDLIYNTQCSEFDDNDYSAEFKDNQFMNLV